MTHQQVKPLFLAYPMSQLVPSSQYPLIPTTQPLMPVQPAPISTPNPQYPNFNLQLQNIQLYPTPISPGSQPEGVTGPVPIPVQFPVNQPIYFASEYPVGQAAPSFVAPPQEAYPIAQLPNYPIAMPSSGYGQPPMTFTYPQLGESQEEANLQQISPGQVFGESFSYTHLGPVYYPPPYGNFVPVQQPPLYYPYPPFFGMGSTEWPVGDSYLAAPKETPRTPKYAKTLSERKKLCGFCKSNRESKEVYKSHLLKDEDGVVRCPILRKYVCDKCNQTGDNAHTISYCPLNQPPEGQSETRLVRNSTGKIYTLKY